ncbi:methionyl-tRNA synthetase [Cotonvirus japonicus]|uniref:methionine--tRNA ligase n=1 Tax=Cotonvirus japonicus TaxID=2811091 RepID=A0ABM7NTN1_9VIRU|nr:methionyl-tRNA synthetase [Cotonvirus japonicus]BCS83466.1 methionyl-tRNA synthetase [Cotonvirus japonicus]
MKYFVTSALPYTNNASPHLGNLVGALLSGDVYTRFKRQQGHEVIYLCGTDEYGTTTMVKARQEGVTCRELCDKYFELHKQVYDWFNIDFDVFGRTSTQHQTEITHEIFAGLFNNGFIEHKTITQTFCETCNMFLADSYIKGICYHDNCLGKNIMTNGDQCELCQRLIDVDLLINPFCGICKTIPIKRETNHMFLKLGELTDKITSYLENTNLKPNIMSIAKSWLNMGLTSRCITRDLTWGTPVPTHISSVLIPYENKVFYVWFDAPIGYYSILANHRNDWREWLNSGVKWVSTQGKDNVPFHTIVFPATILGSGINLPLIDEICGTDYLLYEGEKFSKSQNIGLFGDKVAEISPKLGINEDYWRYYLMKIRPETQDASFSLEEFVTVIKSDLVNNIGNYINRVFSVVWKTDLREFECEIDFELRTFIDKYLEAMENFKFRDGLKQCLELSSRGNQYVQSMKPWVMIKTNDVNLKSVLNYSISICWVLLKLLQPFIPRTSNKLLTSFESNFSNIFEIQENLKLKITSNIELPFKNIEYSEIHELIL